MGGNLAKSEESKLRIWSLKLRRKEEDLISPKRVRK